MNNKLITGMIVSVGMITAGVVAGGVMNKLIVTNSEKERRELERDLEEFDNRKERAIKLEQSKDRKFKEQEEKLKEMQEEIKNLEKLKGELTDNSNLITVISNLTGALKDVKCEVMQIKEQLGYIVR